MPNEFKLYVEVSHPHCPNDDQLADWLERVDLCDPCEDILRWSTPGSTAFNQPPGVMISFCKTGEVEVTVRDRFTRSVSFLNAISDDEKLQQLLDLLINCWAGVSPIGIDLSDVYWVWQHCDLAVIDQVDCSKDLPDYCFSWQTNTAPRLGPGRVSALQLTYREYYASQENFLHYTDLVEGLMDEDVVVMYGVLEASKPADSQTAVFFYGMNTASLIL